MGGSCIGQERLEISPELSIIFDTHPNLWARDVVDLYASVGTGEKREGACGYRVVVALGCGLMRPLTDWGGGG